MTEPSITSTKNPRIRAAVALRDRRERDQAGLTLVDGARELGRVLAGDVDIVEVFVDEVRLGHNGFAVVAAAGRRGAAIVPVSATVLDRLAYGDRSDGLVAVVRIPDTGLAALHLPADPLAIVLEGVEKPGNLGAVVRTADAAGADAVIAASPRTDLFNPNAIRASLGTMFAIPVAAGPSAAVRTHLADRGLTLLAARVDAERLYTDVDLRGPVAVVLGSEADGLTDTWTGPSVLPIRLPMLGVADSLNVSIAAAVILYEARRQRGVPDTG